MFPPFIIAYVSTRLDKPVSLCCCFFPVWPRWWCDSSGLEWLCTWTGSAAFCPLWKLPMSPRHSSSYAMCKMPEKNSHRPRSNARSEVSLAARALRWGSDCEAKSSRSPDSRCLEALLFFHLWQKWGKNRQTIIEFSGINLSSSQLLYAYVYVCIYTYAGKNVCVYLCTYMFAYMCINIDSNPFVFQWICRATWLRNKQLWVVTEAMR